MNNNGCTKKVTGGKYAYQCTDNWEEVHVFGCGENEVFLSANWDDG
jgi:hypothetical protein